jgi:hypothetical protein
MFHAFSRLPEAAFAKQMHPARRLNSIERNMRQGTPECHEDKISDGTKLVLTTESDLFEFLRGMAPGKSASTDMPPPIPRPALWPSVEVSES